MSIWQTLTSNYVINVGFVSWFSAQIIKTILTLLATRKFDPERLVGAGGWPSSHSALTSSISIAVARKLGFASPEFGIALTLAAIVMYDAMGVRRAAGEQAKVLNKMIFEIPDFPVRFRRAKPQGPEDALIEEERLEEEPPSERLLDRQLKEFLGHTPFEVLGGCLLGILISVFMPVV